MAESKRMSPESFAYWLQGLLEGAADPDAGLTPAQVRIVRDHLDLVFEKVTPIRTPKTIHAQEIDRVKRQMDPVVRTMAEAMDSLGIGNLRLCGGGGRYC